MLRFRKKLTVYCLVLFAFCVAVLASCSRESDDPTSIKSSTKAVTAFEFEDPASTGVIYEPEKKISVKVPVGTDLTKLTPTITISEKAIVSPRSGVKQDFTNAVTYTVTAEDGTEQQYVVTVKAKDEQPKEFVVTNISSFEVQAGTEFYLEGQNFSGFAQSTVRLVGMIYDEEIRLQATDKSTSTRLYFTIPVDLRPSEYVVNVTSGFQTKSEVYGVKITPAQLKITGLSPLNVKKGDHVVITGQGFDNGSQNFIRLIKGSEGNYEYDGAGYLDVVKSSLTSIEFVVDVRVYGQYKIELQVSSAQTSGVIISEAEITVTE